jgi:hypothetical protein
VALILDAGALIASERGDVRMAALLRDAQRGAVPVRTTSAVVAQVWRDGPRQGRLARVLAGADEAPLDPLRSRSIGTLLGAADMDDVIDASLVDLAVDGDEILTSDRGGIQALVSASRRRITVTSV